MYEKNLFIYLLLALLLLPFVARGDENPPMPIRLGTKDKNRPKMPCDDFIYCYIAGSTLTFTPGTEQWDVIVECELGDMWDFSVDYTSSSVFVPFTSGVEYLITVETVVGIYQGHVLF